MTETPLRFSAFVMNTTSHIVHGLWRHPEARQHEFNDLEHWVSLAKTLERGGFDFIFFADVIGLYGDYRGDFRKYAETGLQIPSNDPTVIASAIAYATERIGIALTSSILQQHPFNWARQLSTLDHASNGRIAWNIVTSALANAHRNFGLDDLTPHEQRYRWADEYLEVTYKLWEGSWEDDALVGDKTGVHALYEKIHKIDHIGERYRVEGPHLVSPSPQRTPVLFQAGSSPTGRAFAARNAEAQFIMTPRTDIAERLIADTRELVAGSGRGPRDLKFFQGLSFVIGSTEQEARRKNAELEEYVDADGMVAHLSGGLGGIDLGRYELDTPLKDVHGEGTQSTLQWVRDSVRGREATVRDLGLLQSRNTRVVGTPERIADRLTAWRAAGIDGVNVINATLPGSYAEFIEHVMPVLVQRGLARPVTETGTARRKLSGGDRLPDTHPARAYRRALGEPAAV
ncbi:LLM class flavin-dependent oxidoreductase [Sciscionella marina]|uniref:LLM class flavin-dependent oxidoreductase n=1 Tax=Sciscionella marina TaxID=508770 RepID=UPI0003809218|nr:LLM class flavin-dependent oxidoreductase [Sciscionella marina]